MAEVKLALQKGNLVFTEWHNKSDSQYIWKPALVCLYNSNMGGVDQNYQLRKYYCIGCSSSKWYIYLFWFLIDVSICNSFILFYSWGSNNRQAKRRQVSFRTSITK